MIGPRDGRGLRARSLDELERSARRHPDARVASARSRPLAALDAADLRLLLARRQGLAHVLPLAVALLADDPFVEACGHPGDLLCALCGLERAEWTGDAPLRLAWLAVLHGAWSARDLAATHDRERIERAVEAARRRGLA